MDSNVVYISKNMCLCTRIRMLISYERKGGNKTYFMLNENESHLKFGTFNIVCKSSLKTIPFAIENWDINLRNFTTCLQDPKIKSHYFSKKSVKHIPKFFKRLLTLLSLFCHSPWINDLLGRLIDSTNKNSRTDWESNLRRFARRWTDVDGFANWAMSLLL